MAGINTNTVLMLHCNGVDGSTTFTDNSPSAHTIVANGTAQIDTADYKFPTGSFLGDGNSDYLSSIDSSDWNFGTGNLTIDFWFKFAVKPVNNYAILMTQKVNDNNRLNFYFDNRASQSRIGFRFQVISGGSSILLLQGPNFSGDAISQGVWYHVAVTRNGNQWKLYINGTAINTQTVSITYPDWAASLTIGGEPNENKYINGWMDEIRIQKGEAFWTTDFTPYTEAYSADQTLDIDETINLDDDWEVLVNPEQQSIDDTVTLSDSWDVEIAGLEVVDINEQINLDDDWNVHLSAENIDIDETINLDDDWTITLIEITDYGSQIIWLNPLIIVTNTDPAKISSIDITDPENPVKTTYELVGCKNAKGVVYNATNEYFYVICGEGKVCKINKNDLEDQTIINTGETDIFTVVDALDTHLKTYAITDNSDGEIVMIDEREVKKINTDLRWLESIQQLISTRLDWINGKLINTDLRWIATQVSKLKTDLRWIAYEYNEIPLNMIDYSDWVVKINGVDLAPLNDIDMDTVQIVHDVTVEEEKGSTVTFTLHRRFDKLDYTNAGDSSQITNQNAIIIEINGLQEFSGKITNLNCDDEGEIVTVTAVGSRPTDKRHTVSIPLASVNEQLHPYHCILSTPNIDNPYIDTRFVITSDNNKYWNDSSWVAKKSNGSIYANYTTAQNYLEGVNENNTIFWDANPIVRNYEESPPYYKGIQVDLGIQIEQKIIRYSSFVNSATLATQIEEGTFKPKQNWTYFWLASFTHFILGLTKGTLNYIGTSLGSMSTDAWKITGASYKYQKEQADTETELDVYQIGSAPYNVISVTNGRKITKQKWEDRNDGMYDVKDASYDYREYAKSVAALEYQKIQNINGQVLPATSCQISLTLDAYYYYNLGLLTRINISNTTIANTYNGNNGFPVAIKTITIKCATQGRNTMMVTLNCNNQKSQIEMEEIDAQYPDEDSDEFVFSATAVRVYQKFDPNSWSYPS